MWTLELANVTSKQGTLGPVHQQQQTSSHRNLFTKVHGTPKVLGSDATVNEAFAHVQDCIIAANVGKRSQMLVGKLGKLRDCHWVVFNRVDDVNSFSNKDSLLISNLSGLLDGQYRLC